MATVGLDRLGRYRELPPDPNIPPKHALGSHHSRSSGTSAFSMSSDYTAPRYSTMESSGNENNQRIPLQNSRTLQSTNIINNMESSASAQTGGVLKTSLPVKPSNVLKKSASSGSSSDTDEGVAIEEKRKKANGDGHTIHQYLRGRFLGKGGFAKVYLCTALDTSKQYAVKIVPKANLVKARARHKLQTEIKIHRTLKHPNICEYKHFFEDRNNCYILLELCHNQTLNEMIKRRKRLTEPEAALFMNHLLDAVKYMHLKNVIHRDLKLGNLFLDRHLNVKVGDLGLATILEHPEEKRKTICGTPNYIAPEIIQGDKATRGYSFEVDVWSMGVILFTILVGKPPYEAKDVKATYQRILANEYSFPNNVELSLDAKDLIRSMLRSTPCERLSLKEIGSHQFLSIRNTPLNIPTNATHSTPKWYLNEYGRFVSDGDAAAIHCQKPRKSVLPRLSTRQPFGLRDQNHGTARKTKNEKSEGEHIDIQRLVKSTISLPASKPIKGGGMSPTFRIFDDSKKATPCESLEKPTPKTNAEEELISRTRALSIQTSSRLQDSGRCSPARSLASSTYTAIIDSGTEILQKLVVHLEAVLELTASRRDAFRPTSPQSVVVYAGPTRWVSRYVDYTSKYGLGFLLNDGSSGVYFNDSTKTALEAQGETFYYIERRKVEDAASRKVEIAVETHTLSSYPEHLKKKVTLLKHFRNYLLDQQNKDEETELTRPVSCLPVSDTVHVKKWIRTKHAILFRLSDQTIQVVFYDQTEVLLTPDVRYITYVDKNHVRRTYDFTDELVGSLVELEKRLKYTKEVLLQLIGSHSGHR